eukprot:CAMPEP_0177788010 /NCGR_PEP_ID=MMETSP0491_2-20121128/21850_1 /TAXON_ID=63592 /ORGANISM="Tetraselmis chuii, Strain PLY429" /LENGTH=41 /DNA_ID= /DNA_START= /DNA_END= /DNA_ORIENTATION=
MTQKSRLGPDCRTTSQQPLAAPTMSSRGSDDMSSQPDVDDL